MSYILFVRDNIKKEGDQLLLEHQAIISVTRSILANYSKEENGMSLSGHKILVPAHLDILPLLAIVADDYTESVEPEPEKVAQTAPFIEYWDESLQQQNDESLIARYLHPRWFGFDRYRLNLDSMIRASEVRTCVLFGGAKETIERLKNLRYSFSQLVAFNALMPDGDESDNLKSITESLIMADLRFQNAVTDSMKKFDLPVDNYERFGFWSDMYKEKESLPDLERFVAFGSAFEMSVLLG